MAAVSPIRNLCEETTCPICLDYFKDPVIITRCGHNFCRVCLSHCWGDPEGKATPCPQCRKPFRRTNLLTNRQLANFVAIAQKFSTEGTPEDEGKWRLCQKHWEPLKLFCKEEKSPICVVCDRSKEHKAHQVIPLEEAAQEYKGQIGEYLEILRKERDQILALKTDLEKESQDLLKETEAKKEKTVAQFRRLHELLEEQEKCLLAQMEEVENKIIKERDEHLSRLLEKLSSQEILIQEMEEKCMQPLGELLQDIENLPQRCEKRETFENPVTFTPALKWMIWDLQDSALFLESVMNRFRDSLATGYQLQKANVMLDPDTANPFLILSQDCKSVRKGERGQILPLNPERFDGYVIVLGCEGFVSGRHFWEVAVENEGDWGIGVAKKSAKRRGKFVFSPNKGFWAMAKCGNSCRIYPPPDSPDLSLSRDLKRIRVTLNYEGGQVAFFDADSAALLFTYSPCSFSGETILPLFWVLGKTHFILSP